MQMTHNGKPFEYAKKPKYCAISVKNTNPITVLHGCLQTPLLAHIVRANASVNMTVVSLDKKQAIITFSTAPCQVIVKFE